MIRKLGQNPSEAKIAEMIAASLGSEANDSIKIDFDAFAELVRRLMRRPIKKKETRPGIK